MFALSSASAQVRTDAGLVKGVTDGMLTVYRGIPFAAPPLGNLRWCEPQPVRSWRGVRKADTFAPACMQAGVSMPGETPPSVSEDCLYLNVWAPTKPSKEALPVMVWIYGGGFTSGNASMPLYWGDRLARKGVIVVTLAYRVGPFGFLVHPELTRESRRHSSGNYAFMDQIAGLKWVHRNIGAFGGNPGRVAIAGQSAGGASVSVLMSSPLAKGLFQRVIVQSGGMFEPVQLAPTVLLANAEREGQDYLMSLGVRSIGALRDLPARSLLKGSWGSVSHPIIEPYVLPDSPYNTFLARKQNRAAILVGSNADEARALITGLDKIKAATFEEDISKSWGPLPASLLAPYHHLTDAQAQRSRLDFERDLRFGWDGWALARYGALQNPAGIYYYHFTHSPPFPENTEKAGWGPSHYAELWYMFDHLDQENWDWSAADRRLAETMSSYWVNFVKSGNPNGAGLPKWPTFTANRPQVQYLDDPVHSGGVADLRTLQVVDAVYAQVRGALFGVSAKR